MLDIETFSLYRLVAEVLSDSDDPDPYASIPAIVDAIPSSEYESVIASLLGQYVLQFVGKARRAGAVQREASMVSRSGKFGRDARDRYLQRVPLGDGFKFLGEMSAADCLLKAGEDRGKAAELVVWADRWERLAVLLRERRKGSVSDLPSALVGEVLGW